MRLQMKRPAGGDGGPSKCLGGRCEDSLEIKAFQRSATDYAMAAERTALAAFNANGPTFLALIALAGEHARVAQSFARRAGGADA